MPSVDLMTLPFPSMVIKILFLNIKLFCSILRLYGRVDWFQVIASVEYADAAVEPLPITVKRLPLYAIFLHVREAGRVSVLHETPSVEEAVYALYPTAATNLS